MGIGLTRSVFKKDLSDFGSNISSIISLMSTELKMDLKSGNIPKIIHHTNIYIRYLDGHYDTLEKYTEFFETVNKKFGINVDACNATKNEIIATKKRLNQIILFVSQNKIDFANKIYAETIEHLKQLETAVSKIVILPYLIDYEKLENKEWRTIGIAGIHYKSKVFLSYPFRDDDPKKDENQQIIDYYVKPLLDCLEIKAVTARGSLKPQELIDDKIIELVKECDGIIGFYTVNDDVSNVEHELAYNSNIVSICKEEGAKSPSMRFSRLMINFNRKIGLGNLLLGLIQALKSKKLFVVRGSEVDRLH